MFSNFDIAAAAAIVFWILASASATATLWTGWQYLRSITGQPRSIAIFFDDVFFAACITFFLATMALAFSN